MNDITDSNKRQSEFYRKHQDEPNVATNDDPPDLIERLKFFDDWADLKAAGDLMDEAAKALREADKRIAALEAANKVINAAQARDHRADIQRTNDRIKGAVADNVVPKLIDERDTLKAALEKIANGREDSDYYRVNTTWWLRDIARKALKSALSGEPD